MSAKQLARMRVFLTMLKRAQPAEDDYDTRAALIYEFEQHIVRLVASEQRVEEAHARAKDAIFNPPTRPPVPRDAPPDDTTAQALRKYIRRGEGEHQAVAADTLVGWRTVTVQFFCMEQTRDTVDDRTDDVLAVVIQYADGTVSEVFAFEVEWLGFHNPD